MTKYNGHVFTVCILVSDPLPSQVLVELKPMQARLKHAEQSKLNYGTYTSTCMYIFNHNSGDRAQEVREEATGLLTWLQRWSYSLNVGYH